MAIPHPRDIQLAVVNWLDERYPFTKAVDEALYQRVPNFANAFYYCFGGMVFILIVFQLLTGVFRSFYYVPDAGSPGNSPAYNSVLFIQNTQYLGWLIRGVHFWGANLLMYRTDVVKPAPTSWGSVFEASSPYKGKITAYDSPIYIADAALYLSKTKPELGIKDPYSLTSAQLDAAVELLKAQKENISEYWSDYTKEVQAFESGTSVIGTTWQVIANTIGTENKVQVNTVLPKEGSTGWSDTWMVAAKAAHPNCMYKWMDWIISPKVNAQVAEWFGEAPSNAKACAQTSDKNFCKTYHADDQAYFSKVSYWTTPRKQCGDARGNVCLDYSAWVQAWTAIKG